MTQLVRSTIALLVLAVIFGSVAQRLTGSDFRPAAAGEAIVPTQSVAELDLIDATAVSVAEIALPAPAAAAAPTTALPTAPAPAISGPTAPQDGAEVVTNTVATPSTVAAIAAAPVAAPSQVEPAPVVAPAPVPTAPPAPPAPTAAPVATPAPAGCPATWFCYPRVGIAGPIVPYSDCGGTTDIGTSIRSFTCLSPFYLMGHAYTQFGQITLWRAGDIVFASGRQFTITGAFTQTSCAAPARSIAPLSLQTSLTSGGCGSVLVVQGN